MRELLRYDPETGECTWLKTISRYKAGSRAGRLHPYGYWLVAIDGRHYPMSHIAFLYMTGEMPVDRVDHIDRDKANNRWLNLRQATDSQNAMNRGLFKNNKSGFKGVDWVPRDQKWRARICVAGRRISLGHYDDPVAAYEAYCHAAPIYFGEFAAI